MLRLQGQSLRQRTGEFGSVGIRDRELTETRLRGLGWSEGINAQPAAAERRLSCVI